MSLIALLAICALVASASPAFPISIRQDVLVPDGSVEAMAVSGDRIYLGGKFQRMGPPNDALTITDASDGHTIGTVEVAGGRVYAMVPDQHGGWYLGGDFTSIAGVPRANIAQLSADGTVSPWRPPVVEAVTVLLVDGTTVYFARGGVSGNNAVGAADAVSGVRLPIEVFTNSVIRCLLRTGSQLFVGGEFNQIGNVDRGGLAAIDPSSGAVLAWDPGSDLVGEHIVNALASDGTTLFVGGYFAYFGGQQQYGIAALDVATGASVPWGSEDPTARYEVCDLVLDGNTLYAGGSFQRIRGADRPGIAALDATTGLPTSWSPNNPPITTCKLVLSGSTIHAMQNAGNGYRAYGLSTTAVDVATGQAYPWHLAADLIGFLCIGAQNNTFCVSGRTATTGIQGRGGLAALDRGTGALTPWTAFPNDVVKSLAVQGSTVYVGGKFGHLGNVQRHYAVALDAESGAIQAWNPDVNGQVLAIVPHGPVVFIAGQFTAVQGVPRFCLAAVDAVTGVVTDWNPGTDGTVRALAIEGSTLYVGGDFTQIAGVPRNHLASVDTESGQVTPWDPNVNGDIAALALGSTKIYAGGWFTRVGGQRHSRMAAIDRTSGVAMAWDPRGNDTVNALALAGSTLYAGGEFDSLAGQRRGHIAAFRIDDLQLTNWNPDCDRDVRSLLVDDRVYAGGEFLAPRAHLALIESDATTPTLLASFYAAAANDAVVIRWRLANDRGDAAWIERAAAPSGPWRVLDVTAERQGPEHVVADRAALPGTTYYYRLVVTGSGGPTIFGPIEGTAASPLEFALTNVAPIPSAGPVTIEFAVPRLSRVRLEVLDVQGRSIARLVDGARPPGRHQVVWTGGSSQGVTPAGVYFVRLAYPGGSRVRRVVLRGIAR